LRKRAGFNLLKIKAWSFNLLVVGKKHEGSYGCCWHPT
jgi:hypothetical protein